MKKLLQAAAAAIALLSSTEAFAAIKVMTTTQDLASIVAEVGGDKVAVESIAKGYRIRTSSKPSQASSSSSIPPTCWSLLAATWRLAGCLR